MPLKAKGRPKKTTTEKNKTNKEVKSVNPCVKCSKETSGTCAIQCAVCAGWVHLSTARTPTDRQCTTVTVQESKREEVVMNFRCYDCRLNHSVRNGDFSDENPSNGEKKTSGIHNMSDVLYQLQDVITEVESTKQIQVLTSSMIFMASQFDQIQQLQRRVAKLELMATKYESTKSHDTVKTSTHPARKDVIISQIPTIQGENVKKVAMAVLETVGCSVQEEEIVQVERFQAKSNGCSNYLKVRFVSETQKP